MDSGFLAVVSVGDRSLDERVRSDASARIPHAAEQWTDQAGGTLLATWRAVGDGAERATLSGDGAAVLLGHARSQRGPITEEPAQRRLRHEMLAAPEPTLAALTGVFAAVAISATGRLVVGTDAVAYRMIYYGENADVVVVSSRADLVAHTLAGDRPPARDTLTACSLAFAGFPVGDRTGFVGVRSLGAGEHLEIEPDGTSRLVAHRPFWPDDDADLGLDDAVETVRAELAASIDAYLAMPLDHHRADLTGGKDSRLILAAILDRHAAADIVFQTTGPPDLGDVRMATQLAEALGLRHEATMPLSPPPGSYAERARAFVAATGGLANLSDMKAIRSEARPPWLSGVGGELLRKYIPVGAMPESPHALVDLVTRRFGALDLLRPDARALCHDLIATDLIADWGGTPPLMSLGDAFFMRNRVRFARLGPIEDLTPDMRILPIYSPAIVRTAFAIDAASRHREDLHYEVIRRCAPALLEHPITGKPFAQHSAPPPTSSPAQTLAPSPSPPADESLMRRIQQKSFNPRREFFDEVLSDTTNPAWDLLDRDRAAADLTGFWRLNGVERRELLGAVTAAVWLGPE